MQIQSIKVTNMIGARRADLIIDKPVTMFCGANGASKSSIQESIRMAFTGKTLRVDLKKEYPLLVSDGAKTGKAVVVTDVGTASFELPSGTHALEGDLQLGLPDALEYVFNAQAFAGMNAEARRTFLFALTGCNVTAKEVKRRLLEKACEESKVELVLPMLKSGFPAACEFAAKKATESKGAWRAVTGETYGSKKGEAWEAEKPATDTTALDAAKRAVIDADTAINNLLTTIGGVDARAAAKAMHAERKAKALIDAALIIRRQDKLASDMIALADYEQRVVDLTAKSGSGRKEGLLHDFARLVHRIDCKGEYGEESRALIARYEAENGNIDGQGDPEAAAALPAFIKSRDLMQRSVENDRRDIAASHLAQEYLDSLTAEAATPDEDAATLRQHLVKAKAERQAAQARLTTLAELANQAETADVRTKQAKDHHTECLAWMEIATCLAPDGIPSEMLAQALRPINVALKESSIATGWRQPTINVDMSITADGRPYALLSKSEKWRVDAMIAEAITQLSDVRILMLDEVDILEPNARVELLYWLSDRAEAGALNNVLLFATLKTAPTGLPDNIRAIWLQNGVIPEHEEMAEAA